MSIKTPIAPECVLRSKEAAIKLMMQYRYLVPGNAPMPELYVMPSTTIAVFGMNIKWNRTNGFYVSVKYLETGEETITVREQELNTFINSVCYRPYYFPLFSPLDCAKRIARKFKKGMVIELYQDSNLHSLIHHRAVSLEVISIKAMHIADIFVSYPTLYSKYVVPEPDWEDDYSVVIEYVYNGGNQTRQVALLPHLFALHAEIGAEVGIHQFAFYSSI